MSYLLGPVALKVSSSCLLRVFFFFFATVTSDLFVMDVNLHPDFYNDAFSQCLLLKVIYNFELNKPTPSLHITVDSWA